MSILCFSIDTKFISNIFKILLRGYSSFPGAHLHRISKTQKLSLQNLKFSNFQISNFHCLQNAHFYFRNYNLQLSKFKLPNGYFFKFQMFKLPNTIFNFSKVQIKKWYIYFPKCSDFQPLRYVLL